MSNEEGERPPLYLKGVHTFTEGAGEVLHEGKGYSPMHLKVVFDRYYAWRVVESLMQQLQQGDGRSQYMIEFSGDMEEDPRE